MRAHLCLYSRRVYPDVLCNKCQLKRSVRSAIVLVVARGELTLFPIPGSSKDICVGITFFFTCCWKPRDVSEVRTLLACLSTLLLAIGAGLEYNSRKAAMPAFVRTTTHCHWAYSPVCLSVLCVSPSDRARTQVRPGRPQRCGEVHPPQDDGLGRAQDTPEVCMHA